MRLTVEDHCRRILETGEFLEVLLDGVNVTRGCHLADDVEGWVECKPEKLFRLFSWERRTGVVTFVPRPATPDEQTSARLLLRHQAWRGEESAP